MTRLGKMLYDDGRAAGRAEGKTEGEKFGKSIIKLIQKMSADGALADIPRLATEPEFYEAMVEKYRVEI